MTTRQCLECKSTACTSQLIPLHVNEGGSVRVGRAPTGRGAWICPSCLDSAVQRPSAFNRSFRKRISEQEKLPALAQEWLRSRCLVILKQAQKDGLVCGKEEEVKIDHAIELVCHNHTAPPNPTREESINSGITFIIEISPAALGDAIDQEPRSHVKIKPGRTTQSLIRCLRVWDRLG